MQGMGVRSHRKSHVVCHYQWNFTVNMHLLNIHSYLPRFCLFYFPNLFNCSVFEILIVVIIIIKCFANMHCAKSKIGPCDL